ncbi:MAG: hypothetical protein R3A12_03355 [Ignavibacteria bacterium]
MKILYVLVLLLTLDQTNVYSQNEWYWQNPYPQGNRLRSVHFTDMNTGWTAGFNGTILKTTDKGTSWETQISGTSANLNSIQFKKL